ncbi:hypothetical protein B0T22DRAFT_472869 [Podospora appendiculata]|uniref:DUF1993 domain-containing protein n=1 Tax=Podospora appendiculata TaxID=314037 RepID=A0AAE0WZY4_9PEZI|nr:hypothetical protein B0T22DRAFT_472869 [Podospora appendiculata]
MSAITLSELVIPTFTNGLKTLTHILQAAEAHAKANGLDADAEYVGARLIDDMLPLSFQVQNATTNIRKTLNRVTGAEDQPWEDNEKTFAELYKRIDRAQALLSAVDAAKIDAASDNEVLLPFGPQGIKLSAKASVLNQAIPNYFFHVQTAFAILRSKGVPIGKRDFIGSFLELY